MNLLKYPLLTHGLLALVDVAILALGLFHPALGAIGAVWAASLVAVFFYGREAGQLEHDFKNEGVGPIRAWLGATFMFDWPWTNVLQWLVPAVVAFGSVGAYLAWKAFL